MSYPYHVVQAGQSTRNVLTPGGTLTAVREIRGRVDGGPAMGTFFVVQVPVEIADADRVRQVIEAEVDHLTAVADLGGPGSAL